MPGYWKRPEKTAEAIRGKFLHTGDAGTMDADGFVTMRGRFSELIDVGGRTWVPRDIEEAIAAQPGIREAALVGLPDAHSGPGFATLAGLIHYAASDPIDLRQLQPSAQTVTLFPKGKWVERLLKAFRSGY